MEVELGRPETEMEAAPCSHMTVEFLAMNVFRGDNLTSPRV
jgi:hypothetical protein